MLWRYAEIGAHPSPPPTLKHGALKPQTAGHPEERPAVASSRHTVLCCGTVKGKRSSCLSPPRAHFQPQPLVTRREPGLLGRAAAQHRLDLHAAVGVLMAQPQMLGEITGLRMDMDTLSLQEAGQRQFGC